MSKINLLKSVMFSFIVIYSVYVVTSSISLLIFIDAKIAFILPILQLLCFILLPIIITVKNKWQLKPTFKLTAKPKFSYFFVAISSLIGLSILNVGYVSFFENILQGNSLQEFLNSLDQQLSILNKYLFHTEISIVIVTSITIIVIAPISEELLFRGFLLSPLESSIKRRDAIALTAGLFALIHMNIAAFPILFALGLVLGYFASYTKQIYPAIFIHFANNLIAYLNSQFIYNPDIKTLNEYSLSLGASVIYFIFGLFIVVYSIFYLRSITSQVQVED